MGKTEVGGAPLGVAVHEKVEVDRARAVPLPALAPERGLDAEEGAEKRLGLQRGIDEGGGVEVIGLGGADGGGFVEGGAGEEAGLREEGDGGEGALEEIRAVAEVGAERDRRDRQGWGGFPGSGAGAPAGRGLRKNQRRGPLTA